MSRCKWDRTAEAYLADGEPCRTDDYGDPTVHCTARRSCANHIGYGELTCARCLSRTRNDVRRIAAIAPLMGVQALGAGVNSEAAWLAAPAADVRSWSARRIAMRAHLATWLDLERITERQHTHARATMEDDDEQHPYTVLTRWQMMLSEDYGQPLPDRLTTTEAGAYLERVLHRMAQDDQQDFSLFVREMRACREHLESVLRNSAVPERGAPCPSCETPSPRLTLEHGHWCPEVDCNRLHFPEDPDRWVCPRNREHAWTEEDYRRWVADVYEANRSVGT